MRVLIMSDTHGKNTNIKRVLDKEKNIGYIIHLGDIGRSYDYIEETSSVAVFAVRGNNDVFSSFPSESILMLGKHRVLITHGHEHGVSYETTSLRHYARAIDCDTVIFGHTHIPLIDVSENVTMINPGSLTYPRQADRTPTYIIAEIFLDGSVTYTLQHLDGIV